MILEDDDGEITTAQLFRELSVFLIILIDLSKEWHPVVKLVLLSGTVLSYAPVSYQLSYS